jgi:lipid II:glycine glycyltransferase (peptidoglycan interpeptide bridge formation enzyme)
MDFIAGGWVCGPFLGKVNLEAQSGPARAQTWNHLIAGLPQPHILQTWQWSQVKAAYGWQPFFALWTAADTGVAEFQFTADPLELTTPSDAVGRVQAAALVLLRNVNLPGFSDRLKLIYVPKGPLLNWNDASLRRQVLDDLKRLAKRLGAFFIKIDPDVALGSGIPGDPHAQESALGQEVQSELAARGWRESAEQIQFRNTVLIDLSGDEDALLRNMKQKTRYNIRLAARKSVQVRVGGPQDFSKLYRMYAETSLRDGFVIRPQDYYECVWSAFLHAGLLDPLIAEVDGEVVAAVMVFHFENRAWYLYGMSLDLHREKMPNYLLQWEAISRTRAAGCRVYDLWGAPERFEDSDPLWGVFRFKEGFGGQVVRYLGAWDLPVNHWMYRLYTQVLPRILDILRWRGKAETRRQME